MIHRDGQSISRLKLGFRRKQWYIFDKYGRVFQYQNKTLLWLFAPEHQLSSLVAAGDVEADGSVILITKDGSAYRITAQQIEKAKKEGTLWADPQEVYKFLPKSPSQLDFPVTLVDVSIKPDDNKIFVLDNYNRVWDLSARTMVLQGKPSKDLAIAMHFAQRQYPLTIDVNNQLSCNETSFRLPFKNPWFFPIVRDFLLTPDEKGIMIMDLNGNLHYSGLTSIFETAVTPGKIMDRFKKMAYIPSQDTLLLLDDRYRVLETGIDLTGAVARNKLQAMLDGGDYANAYNTLRVLWNKGSQFTPICYDLMNTERLRNIRGTAMYQERDTVNMFVDVLPVHEDLILLLDRWGRIVYENKGNYVLLEGSGITRWPRGEVLDGTLTANGVFFVCTDGTVWNYPYPLFFGDPQKANQNTPQLYCDLNDYIPGAQWTSIEAGSDGTKLYALTSAGKAVVVSLGDKTKIEELQLPPEAQNLFDMAYTSSPQGYALACTSPSGPIFIYTEWEKKWSTVPQSFFGGPVLSDITFSRDLNVIVTDQFGVIHQFQPCMDFSKVLYSAIQDALALRMMPSRNKAIWVRNNGEFTWLRVGK